MAASKHDWFFREWLRYFAKKQADVVRELDWNKAKVSLLASGKQSYTRDDVNEVALYLNLHPFELLMDPADAMALRALRTEAIKVVTTSRAFEGDITVSRTGTDG